MKLKYFFIFLLVTIFCNACGFKPQYEYIRQPSNNIQPYIINVIIDKDFSDEDRLEIDKSLSQWNYVFNNYIALQVTDWQFKTDELRIGKLPSKNNIYLVKVNSKNLDNFKNLNTDSIILAFTNKIGGNVIYIVRDRLTNGDTYYILLHEIAHVFGATHNDYRLMQPYFSINNYQCIDYKTAQQVAEFIGIKISDLNWCFYKSDLN